MALATCRIWISGASPDPASAAVPAATSGGEVVDETRPERGLQAAAVIDTAVRRNHGGVRDELRLLVKQRARVKQRCEGAARKLDVVGCHHGLELRDALLRHEAGGARQLRGAASTVAPHRSRNTAVSPAAKVMTLSTTSLTG